MPIQDDIDDANLGRLEREAQRQKRLAQQVPTVQYMGTDGTTGQARVISGSGAAPVRVANHSNTQARPGDIKRGFAGGFDRGNVQKQPSFIRRPVKVGEVTRFVRLAYPNKTEFWIGGDRQDPIKVLEIDSSESFDRADAEKTGPELDDWGLTVRTIAVPGSPPTYRIRYLNGKGVNWAYDTFLGNRLAYRGGGFWSRNFDYVNYGLNTTTPQTTSSGTPLFATSYRNYGVVPPGALFSFLEWEVRCPQAAGGDFTTTTTWGRTLSYNNNDVLLREGLPATPSQSYSYSQNKRDWNDPVNNNIPTGGPPGGTYSTYSCSSPGSETFFAIAEDSRNHTQTTINEAGSDNVNAFSYGLFDGQFLLSTGSKNGSITNTSDSLVESGKYETRTIYESCNGPWFNGSWTTLTIRPTNPALIIQPSSSYSANFQKSDVLNVDCYLTPTVKVPYIRSDVINNDSRIINNIDLFPSSYMPHLSAYYYRESRFYQTWQNNIITSTVGSTKNFLVVNGVTREFFDFPFPVTAITINMENNKFVSYYVDPYYDKFNYEELDLTVYKETEGIDTLTGLPSLSINLSSEYEIGKKKMLAMNLPDGWTTSRTFATLYFPA